MTRTVMWHERLVGSSGNPLKTIITEPLYHMYIRRHASVIDSDLVIYHRYRGNDMETLMEGEARRDGGRGSIP